MSRTVKIILIVGGVLLVVCCAIGAVVMYVVPTAVTTLVDQSVTESPQEAAAMGEEMLSYELPAGYEAKLGMNLLNTGLRMVLIGEANSDQSDMNIVLMTFPQGLVSDEEEMRQQIQQSAVDQTGGGVVNKQEVERENIIINGEEVVLTTITGTDENGNNMRQMTAPFVAKDGSLGMFMIMGGESYWNEDLVGTFLGSIE